MSIIYSRLPCNEDGSRKLCAQRRAERRQQEAERHTEQRGEPTRDPFYDLTAEQRRRVRIAAEQGRREGVQRAAIEEKIRKQAEIDATPEHERRPRNPWRDLIEQWKGQEYRPEIKRKLAKYAIEAKKEDMRIDAMMAEAKRKYEIDNDPEVIRARAHLESARAGAEPEEAVELARLSGILSSGQSALYWDSATELMQKRLRRVQEQVSQHGQKQVPLDEEAMVLARKEKAAEALQVEPAQPVEQNDVHPLMRAWENRTATTT